MGKIFAWLQGRTTTFLTLHFLVGIALTILGKPLAPWIGFMSAHMGFVVGHSTQENFFNKDGKTQ